MKKQRSKAQKRAEARRNAAMKSLHAAQLAEHLIAAARSRTFHTKSPATDSRYGIRLNLYRGLLNGLHVMGYPFTHRSIVIDEEGGSVRQAFQDVGELLNEAMVIEGRRIGSKTAIDADEAYYTPSGHWRSIAD